MPNAMVAGDNPAGCDILPAINTREFCEFCEHRSPCAAACRGAPVSVRVSNLLRGIAYPRAAVYAAPELYISWCHKPSQRRIYVTEGGTTHLLVVGLKKRLMADDFSDKLHVCSAFGRVKLLFMILPGG
jgi:hypothetical protein